MSRKRSFALIVSLLDTFKITAHLTLVLLVILMDVRKCIIANSTITLRMAAPLSHVRHISNGKLKKTLPGVGVSTYIAVRLCSDSNLSENFSRNLDYKLSLSLLFVHIFSLSLSLSLCLSLSFFLSPPCCWLARRLQLTRLLLIVISTGTWNTKNIYFYLSSFNR